MFKRMLAGLCCLLLVFQLAAPVRAEAGYICFVAAGESILPLSDSTMPFWHNGYLYIASSIFTGVGREALNIGRISNSGQVILYSSGRSLWFEKEKGYAHDTDGNTYYPGGVQRNGEMYVPASVVAQFFGLQYSVTDVKISAAGSQVRGDLAWIRQSGSVLTEQMFVNAASFTIASRYMDYLKEQEDETTDLTPEVPTGVEVEGKRFYLCLAGGENTEALLDALELYRAQAAFFCTPEFMAEQGDLLRRMAATGQAIGILAGRCGSGANRGGAAGSWKPGVASGHLWQNPIGLRSKWRRPRPGDSSGSWLSLLRGGLQPERPGAEQYECPRAAAAPVLAPRRCDALAGRPYQRRWPAGVFSCGRGCGRAVPCMDGDSLSIYRKFNTRKG